MTNQAMNIGVVIPIYKPETIFSQVLEALLDQNYPIKKILIIDSSPEPSFDEKFVENECLEVEIQLLKIPSSDFDHGGTRNLGASIMGDVDAILFLTQDAVMLEDCVENLVRFIKNNSLSAAYARQLPRDEATELEKFERNFNYPESSRVKVGTPTKIDDIFFSNVCSLIKMPEFESVGGFPQKIIIAEDMILAVRMLTAGYKIGYCSEARVKHSHDMNFISTLRRYFDTGVMHKMWLKHLPVEAVDGKGKTFAWEGIKYILRDKPSEARDFFRNITAKACGYYIGKRYKLLPCKYIRNMSSNSAFWG